LLIVEEREKEGAGSQDRPPGHFMEEQHADDTARFIAEVKRLAARRGRQDPEDGWAQPPGPAPR
jgi:hypothetical protein